MRYLVYTPFRCGSSFITRFIEKNHNIQAVTGNKPINSDDEHTICKYHNHNINTLKDIRVDHVITCIRKPTDIFMSAYIKDFKSPNYPYTYEKEPCVENIDDMVDHFLSFDWASFNWCSYDFNFKQIHQLTNLNIWDLPVNTKTGVSYYPGEPNLTVVTHQTLFNDTYFQHFQRFCFTELKFKNITRGHFSYRNTDKYGELYSLFKNKVPQSFFDKYKDLDDKIMSKFFDN